MDQSRIEVPVTGLRIVVESLRQRLAGMEAGRLSDYEHRYSSNRRIKPRTAEQQAMLDWFREVGKMIGADTDLGVS